MNHQLSSNPDRPKQCIGPCGQRGHRNVKCAKCGDTMPFFVGDIANPLCRDCSNVLRVIDTAGNQRPPTPSEIRRYHG